MGTTNQVHHVQRPRDRRERRLRLGFLAYFLWIIPAGLTPVLLTDLPMPHILIGIVGGAQPCSYAGLAGTLKTGSEGGICPWFMSVARP
jgi:hypothetical protein